jgi:predicted regulator of Ras-like GTPase activity (Roadblock/LC7/MglB family)
MAATAQTMTTVSQDARARGTVGIFTEVPDVVATAPAPASAEAALNFLTEMSPDLRGAAILGADGTVLAASGDAAAWAEESVGLLRVADAAGSEPVEQIHVAAQAGEVFALRHDGFVAVAVTERFALASLTFFDMRSALRELAKDHS